MPPPMTSVEKFLRGGNRKKTKNSTIKPLPGRRTNRKKTEK